MNDDKNSEQSVVKTAGRGVIYITLAKLWFMAAGWALVFILPRLFKWAANGDDDAGMEMYGLYGLVFTGVSFINNGIITGTIQSVSKYTAEDESLAAAIKKKALIVMMTIGIGLAVAYAAVSDIVSTHWFQSTDGKLTQYMQLSSIIIVAYACYAVFIGSLNGLRKFHKQAIFDITYTTVKIVAMIGFVLAGFEVLGTVMGFVFAAVTIAIAAGLSSKTDGSGNFPAKKFISFASVLFIYTFILNIVMMIDIYVLSGLIPRMATEAGVNADAIGGIMTKSAGQYKAVQQLAFIPYQAIIAIAFVIFPLISKVTASNDIEKTQAYIKKALRFTAILIVGLSAVFAGVSHQAISLVFPAEYASAAPALSILPFGICAFGLMVMANTILNAAGQKWHALAVVIVGMVAVMGFNYVLIKSAGYGPQSLPAAATGTSAGMAVALSLSGFFVYKKFGTFWPWSTIVRVVVAAGIAVTAGYFMPTWGKLFTLIECCGILVIYFAVLGALKEFGSEDIGHLKQILKRG